MGETMRALRLGERGLEFVRMRLLPSPQPGEALLRVRIAGICATDLEMVRYKAGFSGVLGHEFVGEARRRQRRCLRRWGKLDRAASSRRDQLAADAVTCAGAGWQSTAKAGGTLGIVGA